MTELSFALSEARLATFKHVLQAEMPDVKSSHRCEAAARGLGFKTYASLRADLKLGIDRPLTVDGPTFTDYLVSHKFGARSAPLYLAAARIALDGVLSDYPELSADGMGVYARHSWGRETANEFSERQQKSRAELTDENSTARFLLALTFVQRINRTSTVRDAVGYRRLKHIAESMVAEFPDGTSYGPQYLPAGFVLAAAIHSGFAWKKVRGIDGHAGPEVRFNMAKASVDELDDEIRPNNTHVMDRQRRIEYRNQRRLWGG